MRYGRQCGKGARLNSVLKQELAAMCAVTQVSEVGAPHYRKQEVFSPKHHFLITGEKDSPHLLTQGSLESQLSAINHLPALEPQCREA